MQQNRARGTWRKLRVAWISTSGIPVNWVRTCCPAVLSIIHQLRPNLAQMKSHSHLLPHVNFSSFLFRGSVTLSLLPKQPSPAFARHAFMAAGLLPVPVSSYDLDLVLFTAKSHGLDSSERKCVLVCLCTVSCSYEASPQSSSETLDFQRMAS